MASLDETDVPTRALAVHAKVMVHLVVVTVGRSRRLMYGTYKLWLAGTYGRKRKTHCNTVAFSACVASDRPGSGHNA